MSYKLMGVVWGLKLAHQKQTVLLRLAWHAHDDGTNARPGIEHLAWATGYSVRNVKRILADLEGDELIKADGAKGGSGNVANYTLQLENGVKKGDNSDREKVTSQTQKGDRPSTEKVTSRAEKGDKSDTPYIDEPSIEPSIEPSERKPTKIYEKVIEDCLALLTDLPDYPKNRKENAEHLEKQWAKPRPNVDFRWEVEKFCDHYSEQGFKKNHNPRARLNTWLNNAQAWAPKKQRPKKVRHERGWLEQLEAAVGDRS